MLNFVCLGCWIFIVLGFEVFFGKLCVWVSVYCCGLVLCVCIC